MAGRASLHAVRVAEAAIQSIGLGYDLATDLRLKSCKRRSEVDACLIVIDDDLALARDLLIPSSGGFSVRNVPRSIKCDKGERARLNTDVLTYPQMSEQFNQDMSLSGKIPSGHFNGAFDFSGSWLKDASNTKRLAFDGVFITLYNVALEKSQFVLHDFVKQAVPSSWDPAALARFIEKFGTHIVVGVKMGGKDVVYVKQPHGSSLPPSGIQEELKNLADEMFTDVPDLSATLADKTSRKNQFSTVEQGSVFRDTNPSGSYNYLEGKDFIYNCKRKGGSKKKVSHTEWSHSVHIQPDVISMSFIPITSLLSGLTGSGFLTHAINLYLRYKPQISELQQFLEFQLPRQWAPVFGDFALGPHRKPQSSSALQFRFLGPKLYVNTTLVDVGNRPVTGLRLFLEGKRSNCLAIHLQHLSALPNSYELEGKPNMGSLLNDSDERKYYEKLVWKNFSHICTAPVESVDDLDIVTGAQFEVGDSGFKKVLFLRLHFSKVSGVMLTNTNWEGSPNVGLTQRSGLMSSIISTRFTTTEQQPPPRPSDVNMNSAIYPGGPPVPTQSSKLLNFVDMAEVTRGPQHSPGYWVVSGARLIVDKGKISLKVKYSILTHIVHDDEQVHTE